MSEFKWEPTGSGDMAICERLEAILAELRKRDAEYLQYLTQKAEGQVDYQKRRMDYEMSKKAAS